MNESAEQSLVQVIGGDKFRTTPITSTITQVKQLPQSAIIYKCAASSYWQFRVFLEGAQRKRSTKKTDIVEAQREAKLIYAEMLQSIHGSDKGKRNLSSASTLQVVATSLWNKQDAMIGQGELNSQKTRNERYVFERHIKPFFKDYEINRINSDALEEFKIYLVRKGLSKGSQKSYLIIVGKLLKEAVKKEYIHTLPIMPRVRTEDEPRGYFTPTEYTKLWQTAKRMIGQVIDIKSKKGDVYRRVEITKECYQLILFMRNTYIRPTDIKFIRHCDIYFIKRGDIEFLELRHGITKRHSKYMTSTEHAAEHYRELLEERKMEGVGDKEQHLFLPKSTSRDFALKSLSQQFMVVLEAAELKTDKDGKSRTLYSLRHTAIMTAVRNGISIETIAANARTSPAMIDRFYASHIKSAMEMGTEMVDSVKKKQLRYAEKKANEKEAK